MDEALRNSSWLQKFSLQKSILFWWISKRYEIQHCEVFQTYRKIIAEELAVQLIIDIKTVKARELKIKLGFNQLDLILTKQQSIGLRITKTFINEKLIKDSYVKKFNYIIDFYLPEKKLAIEVDELGHFVKDQITENKWQKELEKYLKCTFTIINPDEKDFSAYDGLGKIQTFIDKLKHEDLKKLKDEIKELKKTKNH